MKQSVSFYIIIGLGILVVCTSAFPTGTAENMEIVTESPVYFEVATEEIPAITELEEKELTNSTPEGETTTLWTTTESPEGEESTQTQFPQTEFTHPDQQEILNELHNIWYYSEGLNEDQNDLKSSLSSLVHMTYARVYDQQNETLGRLKYLLRKLRTRLLNEEMPSVGDPTTTELPEMLGSINIETTPTPEIVMRKKRNVLYGDATVLANADPNENSLYPPSSIPKSDSAEGQGSSALFSTVTPDFTTVQKVIHVNDRLPLVTFHDINYLGTTRMPDNTTPYKSSEQTVATTITSTENTEIKHNVLNQEIGGNEPEPNIKPATVEEIINRIISVLQAPMKLSNSTPKPLNVKHQTPIVLRLKPLANGTALSGTDDFKDLPTYLKTFIEISKNLSTASHNSFEQPGQSSLNFTDYLSYQIDKNGLMETNNSKSTEVTEDSSPVVLTSTQMLSNPTNLLNGTMVGMFAFIDILSNLSNAARLIIFFAVTALILSVALGFNSSLGPPIAILGGLAFVIPVFLLLLFQTNQAKLKSVKENVWNSLNVEDVNRVMDLIADAIEKYQ